MFGYYWSIKRDFIAQAAFVYYVKVNELDNIHQQTNESTSLYPCSFTLVSDNRSRDGPDDVIIIITSRLLTKCINILTRTQREDIRCINKTIDINFCVCNQCGVLMIWFL